MGLLLLLLLLTAVVCARLTLIPPLAVLLEFRRGRLTEARMALSRPLGRLVGRLVGWVIGGGVAGGGVALLDFPTVLPKEEEWMVDGLFSSSFLFF